MACKVAFDGALWFPHERQPTRQRLGLQATLRLPGDGRGPAAQPVPDDALGADYETLRRLPAEYVADDYRQRRGDAVWRLNAESAQGGWLHVLVLLEFQSTDDPSMALRVLSTRR